MIGSFSYFTFLSKENSKHNCITHHKNELQRRQVITRNIGRRIIREVTYVL